MFILNSMPLSQKQHLEEMNSNFWSLQYASEKNMKEAAREVKDFKVLLLMVFLFMVFGSDVVTHCT